MSTWHKQYLSPWHPQWSFLHGLLLDLLILTFLHILVGYISFFVGLDRHLEPCFMNWALRLLISVSLRKKKSIIIHLSTTGYYYIHFYICGWSVNYRKKHTAIIALIFSRVGYFLLKNLDCLTSPLASKWCHALLVSFFFKHTISLDCTEMGLAKPISTQMASKDLFKLQGGFKRTDVIQYRQIIGTLQYFFLNWPDIHTW